MAKLEEIPKKKAIQDKISELEAIRAQLELGGGKERIDKQHASGKLTARDVCASSCDVLWDGRQRAACGWSGDRVRNHRWAPCSFGESGFHRGGRCRGRNPQQQSG